LEAEAAIRLSGAAYPPGNGYIWKRFLPPYIPDFNPIEKSFSRLKDVLRKIGERPVAGLWYLIGRLVDMFQPRECANYFSSCGYDPD
jgi:transposase